MIMAARLLTGSSRNIRGTSLISITFCTLSLTNKSVRYFAMAGRYPQRKIGDDNVSAEGLGCMGMSFSYTSFGGFNNEQSYEVLTKATDMGVTLWVSCPKFLLTHCSARSPSY